MYWLLGSKSQLSIENKLLLYKAILKSRIMAFNCGAKPPIQTWKYSKDFKTNRIIVDVPYNDSLHHDLNMPTLEMRLKDSQSIG